MDDKSLNAWIAEYVMGWTNLARYACTAPYEVQGHNPDGKHLAVPCYTSNATAWELVKAELAKLHVDIGVAWVKQVLEIMYETTTFTEGQGEPSWIMAYQMAMATPRQKCEAMYAIREHIETARIAKENAK